MSRYFMQWCPLYERITWTLSARGPNLDVKFWRQILTSKVDPCSERIKKKLWPYTRNIGIQMERKDLIKTFMIASNWKTLWSSWFISKYVSALRVYLAVMVDVCASTWTWALYYSCENKLGSLFLYPLNENISSRRCLPSEHKIFV